MAFLFDAGIFSVEGLSGEILPGTKLYWYESGTSTPLATYSNEALTTPNANPVLSDSEGRFPSIWLQDANYKLVMELPNGTQRTRDPIRNPGDGVFVSYTALASDTGADLIGYKSPLPQATRVPASAKLAEGPTITDFGGNPSATADVNTAALQRALDSGAPWVGIPGAEYAISAGGLAWRPGVEIHSNGGRLKRTGNPTAPCLNATLAGIYKINGLSFDDGGHSTQNGMIETNHPGAKLFTNDVFATNGYAGIWVKQAAGAAIRGGEISYTSHNVYLGDNNAANLPGVVNNVTVENLESHHARPGGDGLKTVSGVKKLVVLGGRYYANAQDGLDLFAGCDEADLIGVSSTGNGVHGADIKVGDQATYPDAVWGRRRRVNVKGGFYSDNSFAGIKVYGDEIEGYYQDASIIGAEINGNQQYAVECRGLAPKIIGNSMFGNGLSTATAYAVIYLYGHASLKAKGGLVALNTIGNNGVAGKTNTGINIIEWDGLAVLGNIIGNLTERAEAAELDWGIATGTGCTNIYIDGNQMGALNQYKVNLAAGTVILGNNPGVPLLVRGQTTIPNGSTTVAVNHGAAGRPNGPTQVRLWPQGDQFGSGYPYSGATSTTQINPAVSTTPSSTITLGWEVDLRGEVNTYAILY